MNRRDYAHTIYPPVAQLAFYVITFLSPTMTFMKVAMVLFEGLSVYGFTLLLRELSLPREWILLYAWCPLCIWEFGGSGHLDAMVIAFMVFAFLFRLRRRPGLTGLLLGLAIFSKFYPLVLFPALYQRRPDGRLDWKLPAAIIAVAIGSYSVYLSAGKLVFGFLGGYVQEEGMETGTRYFLLELAEHVTHRSLSSAAYLVFAGAVFLALIVWSWRTCCRPGSAPASFLRPAMCFALAMMLLFSPHYPWYVAWLIPFLVLCPSLTVLTYVCGLFYLCTTQWATGSGAPQFYLNEQLYCAVLIAAVVEFALYRIPATRRWLARIAPYAYGYSAEAA
jgi:alpha-1,6-mannosyltransferase